MTTTTIPANRRRVSQYGDLLEIVSLERVGSAGWQWTMRRQVLGTDQPAEERTYRTNGAGRGLWQRERQTMGAAEFSLPTERAAAIRQLLRAR